MVLKLLSHRVESERVDSLQIIPCDAVRAFVALLVERLLLAGRGGATAGSVIVIER